MTSKNDSLKFSEPINELLASLTESERTSYNRIIRSTRITKADIANICTWCDECYTRNCIVQNEKFELIVICWEKGQATPIHDHGGEECWVKVIEGEFKETIYNKSEKGELEIASSIKSETGGVTYMVDFMGYHRLENLSDERSITLHLYAKPIRSCNVYIEEEKTFLTKKMSYDTVSGLSPELR